MEPCWLLERSQKFFLNQCFRVSAPLWCYLGCHSAHLPPFGVPFGSFQCHCGCHSADLAPFVVPFSFPFHVFLYFCSYRFSMCALLLQLCNDIMTLYQLSTLLRPFETLSCWCHLRDFFCLLLLPCWFCLSLPTFSDFFINVWSSTCSFKNDRFTLLRFLRCFLELVFLALDPFIAAWEKWRM